MSLRDRLKSKKEAKTAAERGEFRISIAKVTHAVNKMKNPADLGNIVKELAKFLNTLEANDAQITFSGNFDLGQKTLLNCILGNFLDDGSDKRIKNCTAEEDTDTNKPASKLIRKRKSVKERLAEKEALEAEESEKEE